jgi:hypothetical protein
MEPTYNDISEFMQRYFDAFNSYAQNSQTKHLMHDYFAPDLEFIPYIANVPRVSGRDKFLDLMSAHPHSHEMLTPEELVIDVTRKAVVALIKVVCTDTLTKEVLVVKKYLSLYPLAVDEKQTIKIRKIQYFWEVLPPGTLDIGDVFGRDGI